MCVYSNSNNMCNDRPNPSPFTQDSIQGLQCVSPSSVCVCACVSLPHARQESHISWSQTSYFSTPSRLSLLPPSSPNSVIIFCQHSFSSLRLTTKIHLFSSSPHFKELSGKYSVWSGEGFESERVKDGWGWMWCGDLAGNSNLSFVAFLLCK